MAALNMGMNNVYWACSGYRTYSGLMVCFTCRIVNSELHHCAGILSSLDNVSAFGSSLFDVWASSDGRN